jgi:hypothetical protein
LLALGLTGVLSVGLIYLIAAIVTAMTINATPHVTARSWFEFKFFLPQIAAFVASLAIALR